MTHKSPNPAAARILLAALSGGFAAMLGGMIFVGGLLALDVQGLGTLAAGDGWVRALAQLGGVVGCFGMMGFALGPIVEATSGNGRHNRK